MDFFAAQDQAYRKTGHLVAMLIAGLAAMTVAVYLAVMLIVHLGGGYLHNQDAEAARSGRRVYHDAAERWAEQELVWWDGHVALAVLGFMILIVGGGYLYRWAQMRKGGEHVAEMLGGRLIDRDTRDPDQRKALNVVEEMAIASGMPVPPVYMMPSDAINAFAAGHSVDQAVIGLTEGCVANLTRDELQGVVAHEFSHIFNGDMRLNIRLVSVISGVMALGITGYVMWRYIGYMMLLGGGGRSNSGKGGNNAMPVALGVMLLGILLCVIGFAGTLVARLIQAAVSRQREFLADASAVQYTRNPDGISGALRRIGAMAGAKTKLATETSQFNHMFFSQAMPSMFDSHPPLTLRISRIENIPVDQIGEFKAKLTPEEASRRWDSGQNARRKATTGGMGHMIGAVTAAALADSLGSAGQIGGVDMAWTREVLSHIPDQLKDSARAPERVAALVLALLIHEQSDSDADQAKVLAALDKADDGAEAKIKPLLKYFDGLDDRCRVPLLDLASPALAMMSTSQGAALRALVEQVVMADGRVSRFEWVAAMLIDAALDRSGDESHRATASIASVANAVMVLLAVTVRSGHTDDGEALQAMQSAAVAVGQTAPASVPVVSLSQLNTAVHDLRTLRFSERGRLLQALVQAIEHDGRTTVAEAEMVRAVAEMLAVPMPPVVPDAA